MFTTRLPEARNDFTHNRTNVYSVYTISHEAFRVAHSSTVSKQRGCPARNEDTRVCRRASSYTLYITSAHRNPRFIHRRTPFPAFRSVSAAWTLMIPPGSAMPGARPRAPETLRRRAVASTPSVSTSTTRAQHIWGVGRISGGPAS